MQAGRAGEGEKPPSDSRVKPRPGVLPHPGGTPHDKRGIQCGVSNGWILPTPFNNLHRGKEVTEADPRITGVNHLRTIDKGWESKEASLLNSTTLKRISLHASIEKPIFHKPLDLFFITEDKYLELFLDKNFIFINFKIILSCLPQ